MPSAWSGRFLVVIVLAIGCNVARADGPRRPHPPVDDEFLEFLGSVDSDSSQPEDYWWIDYLSKTDASKVNKPPASNAPAGGNKPPSVPAKPSTPVGSPTNG
jgi:hypothetical protein